MTRRHSKRDLAAALGRAARALLLAVAAGLAGPASAHDFWIVPSSFRPQPGSALYARLRVGQSLRGDAVRRNDALIERFALVGPRGVEQPLLGPPAADPAGRGRVGTEPGLYWVVYQSRPSRVDLEPEKVALYAEQEGLERFLGLREGETPPAIRDFFSRCAKALVQTAGPAPGAGGFDRVLGLPLELVPEADPSVRGAAGELPVQLLRAGEPLEGALVTAFSERDPERRQRHRTDASGRVRIELGQAGLWLVKAVHIAPVAGAPGDWRSLWASLVFEVPPTAASPADAP